jgi:subtilisin-like proprotein convertase family protein
MYSGSGSFAGSTGSLNQFVETPTTTSSGAFCNAGGITMPGQGDTSPYPSVVNVTGISNAVATVSLTLNGFSWSPSANAVHLLLVAPSNQAFEFFAATTDASAGNYIFTDTGTQITEADEEGALSPGTWQPAVYTVPPPPEDVFTPQPPTPAPQVPGSFTVAAPRGNPSAGTFENTFNGATANGAWALFVYDDAGTTASGSITGGWCLDITQASGAATTTTVTTAPDPSLTSVSVTVTATVKSGGNPINSMGTVTFTENGQNVAGGPASPVSVNSSGQASFSTTALPEGDHNILATYNGVANTYALSFGNKIQRVDSTTTSSINSGVISYCNPGTITIPSLSNSTDEGQASPNPSNIFVANAPGTIKQVTITLNGVELSTPYYLTSLLVGPLNTTADSLDFFSDVGGSTPMTSAVNVTLDDNAASSLGTGSAGSPLTASSFKPTSGKGSDTFFASADGFYTPPSSPYLYAEPFSSTTLGDVFDSQNPNGTWSLYLNQDNQSANSSMKSWCVNLTANAPVVTANLPSTSTFTQGQTGQFGLTIENTGPGSTGDPTGTNPMTVVDNLSSAFSYAGFTGSGWSCGAAGQTVTCTNESAIADGDDYPTLTIDVNVSGSASGTIDNSVSVSGAGAALTNSNTDAITIDIPPAITSGNSTTFTVGSAGSFSVTGTGTPAPTFGETGPLPNVVTLSTGGLLSGTPSVGTGGQYPITITASNAVSPDATQSFTLTVDEPPTITSANSTTFTPGTNGSFSVTASGYPASTFSETGPLPSNVTLSPAGSLSGIPAAGTGGTYPITITASNGIGTNATQSFTLTVSPSAMTINWTPVGTIIAGDAGTGVLTATPSCGACGTFSYTESQGGFHTPPVGISSTSGLAAGTYTITANFTPTNPAAWSANSAQATLVVSGESVWIVNSGAGGTSELAGNGAGITSSADTGANAAVAIDNAGNVWSVGTGPLVKETTQVGTAQNTITSGGGLNTPAGVAIDGNGQVWVTDGSGALSLFSNSASVISPSGGIMDPTLLSTPGGIAVDLGGSVWIANTGNNSVTRILGVAGPVAPLTTAAANGTTGAKP